MSQGHFRLFLLQVRPSLLALLILRALKMFEVRLKQEHASRLRLKWKVGEYDAASAISALRDADLSQPERMAAPGVVG
jgi:hypothetical protein